MATRLDANILKQLTSIVGPSFVLTQPADLLSYSFDSALDRAVPQAVVLPGAQSEVARLVSVLAQAKIPFVARGAATSLCGGPIPLNNAVVIALTRLKKIGKLNKTENLIAVEPGVVNLRLQQEAEKEGLFYAPDPGSQKACTIGGNVASNAGGPHCLKYGVTSNSIYSLDIVLPNGQTVNVKTTDDGYDLVSLFVGSEGTLGIVTRVMVKLHPKPTYVRTVLVSFHSIEEAIQSVTDIIAAGILPATLEAMDKTTVEAVEAFVQAGYPLEAEGVLLIEVDGDDLDQLDNQVRQIYDVCQKNNSFEFRFAKSEEERKKIWEGRRGSYAAMARLAPNVLVEDGAVPRTRLPEALAKIKSIAKERGLKVSLLFHAGDGNLHPQIIFDERNKEETKLVKEAGYLMLKACVDLGGTISGEHGVGIDKREAMKWLFTRETLNLFRRIKNAFDPDNLCNPEKLIPLVSKKVEVKKTKDPDQVEQQMNPLGHMNPQSEEDLISMVKDMAQHGKPFGIRGRGTQFKVEDNVVIDTSKLDKIKDFDKGNLTITVQAGVPLSQVRAEVEKEKQYLWVAGEGSVGGTIATRRSFLPPLRDQILGMRVLLPTGDVVSFGAKTMKNVAGYDAAKLLIGSWGTLGVILDVTFRLFPTPNENLMTRDTYPFLFSALHKKIKRAFDPSNLLSQRAIMYTASDIRFFKENKGRPPTEDIPPERRPLGQEGFEGEKPLPQVFPQEPEKESQPKEKDPEIKTDVTPDKYGDGFWKND